MKHSQHSLLPSHAGEIPEGKQIIYDNGLQDMINDLPVHVPGDETNESISRPQTKRGRKLNRGFLQRATAGTLLATSIAGTIIAGNEAAKGTEHITTGHLVAESYTDQDFLRMGSDIVLGFEKVLGGACEIIDAQDQHGLPQDARPELQGRTAVKLTLHMKYSPEAQKARDENNGLGLSGNHLDEAEPKLGAYTISSDNSRVAIWLGQGSESNPAYSGVGLMTHAPITPTHEKDGGASYYVDQTLYLPDAANKPPVSSVNFQVTTSVKLMTTNSATEIARSTADCDGKLEVRDGSWQLAK